MKRVVFFMIGSLSLIICGNLFAWGCSNCSSYRSSSVVGSCGYISCTSAGGGCPVANDCDCTDPYCTSVDNTCMTCSTCCDAFGNVGAR